MFGNAFSVNQRYIFMVFHGISTLINKTVGSSLFVFLELRMTFCTIDVYNTQLCSWEHFTTLFYGTIYKAAYLSLAGQPRCEQTVHRSPWEPDLLIVISDWGEKKLILMHCNHYSFETQENCPNGVLAIYNANM